MTNGLVVLQAEFALYSITVNIIGHSIEESTTTSTINLLPLSIRSISLPIATDLLTLPIIIITLPLRPSPIFIHLSSESLEKDKGAGD